MDSTSSTSVARATSSAPFPLRSPVSMRANWSERRLPNESRTARDPQSPRRREESPPVWPVTPRSRSTPPWRQRKSGSFWIGCGRRGSRRFVLTGDPPRSDSVAIRSKRTSGESERATPHSESVGLVPLLLRPVAGASRAFPGDRSDVPFLWKRRDAAHARPDWRRGLRFLPGVADSSQEPRDRLALSQYTRLGPGVKGLPGQWQTAVAAHPPPTYQQAEADRKSTRLNSSHGYISYAVFC